MRWEADLSPHLVEKIWADPYGLLASGEKLHNKLNSTVARISESGSHLVLKHQDSGRLVRRVRKSLSRSPVSRSWSHSRLLWNLGIPTPRSKALLERRIGPLQTSCFLLTDYIPGTTLYRLIRHGTPSHDELQSIAEQLADLWEKLDSRGICHNDFKPENLLVDAENKLWLIDFDRMYVENNLSRRRKRQVKDLQDLLHTRSWRTNLTAAELIREALLQKRSVTRLVEESVDARNLLNRPLPEGSHRSALVTVLIPCRNATATIVRCIESVRDAADEILVADAGSTDLTLDLVRKVGGCKIIQKQDCDAVSFETWAQRHVQHPWTLRILPEEQLNPELGRQVQDVLVTEPREDAFLISRAMQFRGRRLEFGDFQRDTSLRLYRSKCARYQLKDAEVNVMVPSDRISQLKSCLIYELSPVADVSSSPASEQALAVPKHVAGIFALHRSERRRAVWEFFRSYVLLGGWLDGRVGLEACMQSTLRQVGNKPTLADFQHFDVNDV